MNKKYKNGFIFVSVITVFGLVALQIPFTTVLGAGVKFTLFDFVAPTFGAFLSTGPGILSVFLIQLLNILLHGATLTSLAGLIRLFPILFAVLYFAKKRPVNLIIPALAILIFNLHPIGRSAWQYSMLWLIPIAAYFYRKNLFMNSLGATFTAHAVGGALWVWAFGLSKQMWLSLIPQTLMERFLMAGGITISYYALVKAFSFLKVKKLITLPAFSPQS